MATLTGCLKKAGKVIHADDKAAILARAKELRADGATTAESAKQAVQEQLDKVAGLLEKAKPQVFEQAAYHGTPHRFDKFTTDKMGTGEGAQAFGWGLYFTSKKNIAEYYRKTLSRGRMTIDGQAFDPGNYTLNEIVGGHDGDNAALAKRMREYVKENAHNPFASVEDATKIADAIDAGTFQRGKPGQLYEVDVPESSEMLHWDKPLSEQPAGVREVLQAMADAEPDKRSTFVHSVSAGRTGEVIYRALGVELRKDTPEQDNGAPRGWGSVVQTINDSDSDEKAASGALREAGIKGIDYPAQSLSGGSKDDARNFVVFSGDDVAIRNTFYQGQQGPRGTFDPSTNTITLLQSRNLSTFLHESGHFFLEVMSDLAGRPNAPAQVREDMDKILKWFGVKGDEQVGGADTGGALEQGAPAVRAEKVMERSPVTGKPEFDLFDVDGNKLTRFRMAATADEAMAQFNAPKPAPIPMVNVDAAPAVPAKGKRATNWQVVKPSEKFTNLDEDDGYLYHVTNTRAALDINREGLVPNSSRMFGGAYAGHSAGRVFLTERSGVSFWMEKVELQLQDKFDRPPGVRVVRIPKDKISAKLQPDEIGSKDARAPAYYAEGEVLRQESGNFEPTTPAEPAAVKRTPLETWRAMTLDQKRPYHERWAESFEQFLLEGRAPSLELRGPFQRFRSFLVSVYKSLKDFLAGRQATPGGQAGAFEQGVDQTNTHEFKAWFGDSKAVDAKGRPLVVYHGSPDLRFLKEDGKFKTQKERLGFGYDTAAHWFTPSRVTAKSYTDPHRAFDYQNAEEGVFPAYISLQNPLIIEAGGANWRDAQRHGKTSNVIDEARNLGHDGVIIRNVKDDYNNGKSTKPTDTYVVFESTQIKSAEKNSGAFGPADPNVFNQADAKNPLGLTDEIRSVMDRMLATDEQIAAAEEYAGMVPDADATEVAKDKLNARSIRDLKWAGNAKSKMIKELQAKAKGLRDEMIAKVTAEVDAMPVYKAQAEIAEADKEFAEHPTDADPGLRRAVIAELNGFDDTGAMMAAIDAAQPKAELIDSTTDQRMLEEHGDLVDQRAIEQAALEAVHNDVRARALATELKAQQEMLGVKVGSANTLAKAAQTFAEGVVANIPLGMLKRKAWAYLQAERRAGKAWQTATAAAKTEDAVAAKRDQVLNNAIVREIANVQAEVDKAKELFARVTKGGNEKIVGKGRDPDIVNAARAVLQRYGVAGPSTKTAADYLKAVKEYDPETFEVIEPYIERAEAAAKPMDKVTVDELRMLHDDIEALWILSKETRQSELDGNKLDIDDIKAPLLERLDAYGVPTGSLGETGALTEKEKRGLFLQGSMAWIRRVEAWAEGMDGKWGGIVLRSIYQPVKNAADRYRAAQAKAAKDFGSLIANVGPLIKERKIEAPEIGYTFGRGDGMGTAELLHAILHTGNESNKRKLLLGREWASKNADGTLDTSKWDAFIKRMHNTGVLTKAHYDFAQHVWDLMEATKPAAQRTHREVFGRYFNEVTATPFDTPFGRYEGGYVPAQVDTDMVPEGDIRALYNLENENMAYSFPSTPTGSFQSRVEYNRPLKLDLRLLATHVDQVLLFTHMTVPVRGVNRLLRDKEVSSTLTKIQPKAYSGMLVPWLNRSAKQTVTTTVPGDPGWGRLASLARARAGIAIMFGNVSNTVQQITGPLVAMGVGKVEAKHMRAALAQFIAEPRKSYRAALALSEPMRLRLESETSAINGNVRNILLDPSMYRRAQDWTMEHAYFLQNAFDMVLSPMIWTAAYNQRLAGGEDLARFVADGLAPADAQAKALEHAAIYANSVINQTQGSNTPEDVARISTGPAMLRLFTQFADYFNMIANTNATAMKHVTRELGVKAGAGKMLGITMLGLLAPIWIAEAIAQAFKGGPDDEDKDGWYLDDWFRQVFLFGTAKSLLAGIPVIGQAGVMALNKFDTNPNNDRITLAPAISMIESSISAPFSVYEALAHDVGAQKAVRDSASLATMLTGLPFSFAARPVGYLAGMADNKINPTGPADMARGLVTGVASPESKQ